LSQYYFLVSSLPYLTKDSTVQLTVSSFMELCREQLTKNDLNIIEKCSLDNFIIGKNINSTYLRWQLWEINLRNELLKLRSQKKGAQQDKYLVSCDRIIETDEVARNAFNQASPLDAENMMDNARWNLIESMEVGNYFNLEKLILYSLKLQILEKKASYNKELGIKEFNMLKQTKLENIKSGENIYGQL